LKELGIVVSQDSLVEDVHFSLKYTTPYQLGYKSIMVNISDICASGAKPEYLTVSISLPKHINTDFVKKFYEGAKTACGDVKIVGGDITGSDKIFISITAIGNCKNRKISSRSNAKVGYKVIVSGEHGNSAKGLQKLLKYDKNTDFSDKFIQAHLMPVAQISFSKQIAENIDCEYAMMDSSDGLADALMQIAQASKVCICVDTKKIPYDKAVDIYTVLYGGEDYQLIAAVPDKLLKNLSNYTIIGEVVSKDVGIKIDDKFYSNIDDKIYNHFEEKHEE
jgi:thiamine-monophosphate kinase